jgi:hypothetical protein
MEQPTYQTVRIARGRHDSPARGACVIEVASMVAGERFTDHPRSVCPVIAAFLRAYNDLLPEGEHDELYRYAALVVGTAAPAAVRRERAQRILTWAGLPAGRGRLRIRLTTWDVVLAPAARAAVGIDPRLRRARVAGLIDDLVAIGAPAPAPEPVAAPPEAVPAVRGG